LATAKLSIDKGYRVIVLGRSKNKLSRALAELGENAAGNTVDATDEKQLKETMGGIDKIDHLVVGYISEICKNNSAWKNWRTK
jgi:NADP-dependent 3-hydroxy acid dehydrogenase YdfG